MQPIVFLDTETGGNDPTRHPLLTIGLVTLTDEGVARPLHLRVKHPEYCVQPAAMAVNGINLVEHDALAQPPEDVAAQIRAYAAEVGRVLLGGHNFSFDLGFLRALLPDRTAVFRRGHVDTKVIAQYLIHTGKLPKRAGTTLHGLTGHFEIASVEHDALEDARATAEVYARMLKL